MVRWIRKYVSAVGDLNPKKGFDQVQQQGLPQLNYMIYIKVEQQYL